MIYVFKKTIQEHWCKSVVPTKYYLHTCISLLGVQFVFFFKQENFFAMMNLLIHISRIGPLTGPQGGSKGAGLRRTNTFQSPHCTDTHVGSDRHVTPWSLAHPPVQSRSMSLSILQLWPLKIKSTMRTGYQAWTFLSKQFLSQHICVSF